MAGNWPPVLALLLLSAPGGRAWAQEVAPMAVLGTASDDEADRELDKVEPDFTVIDLPTTLRLPRHRLAFRVTHRFTRPLGAGDLGDLAGDFFGLDSGAQIGLELRFGLLRGLQVGAYRTSDRDIQFFADHDLVRPEKAHGFAAAVFTAVDGQNNFRDERTPTVGLVLSRRLGTHGALYVVPMFVSNVDPEHDERAQMTLVGLGGRLRLGESASLVAEWVPRVSGHRREADESDLLAFGLEGRVGGHSFQLNVSNGLGTTLGQVARGGFGYSDWFLGFNISRKFF
jgi:Membrane bound beta barrel domain (DUF5777)